MRKIEGQNPAMTSSTTVEYKKKINHQHCNRDEVRTQLNLYFDKSLNILIQQSECLNDRQDVF